MPKYNQYNLSGADFSLRKKDQAGKVSKLHMSLF